MFEGEAEVRPETVMKVRDVRDHLEHLAKQALDDGKFEDHYLLARAYHRLADIKEVGYRVELRV